ncbi:hypothetical protein ACJJTC_003175, partial [Scirpophaga incertulas]
LGASPEPRRLTITEPPHHVEFSNDTGAMLSCSTRGEYQVDWLLVDGATVISVPGLRRVLANGSLELLPFSGDRYRRDVHSTIYRCRLTIGSSFAVLSKNVHVHAALNLPWEVHVPDEYVIAGNAAVLRCVVPAHCIDRVAGTDWLTDDNINVLRYLGPKYQSLDDGSLYISAVSPTDRYHNFRCRVRERITGIVHSSQYYGHLIVTEPKGGVRPRVAVEPRTRRVHVGQDVRLPCAAHAWPVPTYRWFREHHEQLTPIEKSSVWPRARLFGGGLLRIQDVQREDAGRFVCWLNNTVGGESVHFTLVVTEPISVRIKPEIVRSKLNSDINFECKVSGHPIEIIYWVHNAKVVKANGRIKLSEDGLRLHVKNSQLEDQGVYQCFVSNAKDQAYGIAEYVSSGGAEGKSRSSGNRSRRAPYARSAHTHDAADWNFTGTR